MKQDYVVARKWYERGAALGSHQSMKYIGDMYNDGRGVLQDREQARQWYQKAADAGNNDAKTKLKSLL